MAWKPGRPLPSSVAEAAEKIDQLMAAADARRTRQVRAAAAVPSLPQPRTFKPMPGPRPAQGQRYAQPSTPGSAGPPGMQGRTRLEPISASPALVTGQLPAFPAGPGQPAPDTYVGPRAGLLGLMLVPRRFDFGLAPPPAIPSWLADVGWDPTLSPTDEPVDEKEWQGKLAFDPEGYNSWGAGLRRWWQSPDAWLDSGAARDSTTAEFPEDINPQDDQADAFRHALWAYLMTRDIGSIGARRWHDAHEISEPNEPGVRMMDVFNGRAGIQLALDPANRGRSPADVIREALRSGKLQTRPFKIKGVPEPASSSGPGLCTPYQHMHGYC